MMNEAEHVDVEYVFRYLLYSDAFEFCSSYELKYVRTIILIYVIELKGWHFLNVQRNCNINVLKRET